MADPTYTLRVLDDELSVVRLPPDAALPPWVGGDLWSITRTPTELSLVCRSAVVPPAMPTVEAGWRAMSVVGSLDFSLVGVLASLATACAEAEVPIFVLSTFDTDWLLVKEADVGRAMWALRAHGHEVVGGSR